MRVTPLRAAAAGIGLAAASYATWFAVAWIGYGQPAPSADNDPLLDRFMPTYEVAERHHIRVAAPPEITLIAAKNIDLGQSRIINAIFKTREFVLRATPDDTSHPRALLEQMKSLGWGVLAEAPGQEIVVGAVTQPWKGNVTFRAIAPDKFAAFNEPDFVKIVWTLRMDAQADGGTLASTETRVCTTDPQARAKFRRYWSLASPGIVLIRRIALSMTKQQAEARSRTLAAK